ncbi:MAG TPA: hypothetical protein VNM41_03975, partial [Solirubrobacterales bacterium]|nr:hypothetical protein [Solirubrobacterales bacterium]
MAIQGDPEQHLMQEAWARLWKPGTRYYLPDVIVNGAQGNGVVVDPLGRLVVPDTGSIPLFENSVLGSVAVELSNGTLGGLDTLGNGGMQYDTASGAFSATVTIGELSFDGDYAVVTGGAAGCAIDSAASILKIFGAEGDVAGAAEGGDEDLDLARTYRERLLGTKNGPDLVVTYYYHNEAMDEIVSNDAVFQTAWRTHETEGKTTADFAKQTSTAAERPEDPQATVGDEAYEKHSAYMSTLLLNRALWMKKQHGDPDGRWLSLAEAVADAKGQAQQAPSGPKTVDQVIQLVESPPSDRVEATAADP